MAQELCAICHERPAVARVSLVQNGQRRELALCELHYRQLMRQQRTIVSGILAEGQIRGEIRQGDAMVLSVVVGGSMRGLLHMLSDPVQLINSGIYAQDLVDRTFEVLKAGLRPEGAQGEAM